MGSFMKEKLFTSYFVFLKNLIPKFFGVPRFISSELIHQFYSIIKRKCSLAIPIFILTFSFTWA